MRDTRLLDALASYRGFVVYRLRPGSSGKLDKVPVDPRTGRNCDWMSPNSWMYPHEALLAAQALGPDYGVGLVLIPDCNLFVVDLDAARDPAGGWLPHVRAFEEMFRGGYLETSVSGTGRHIVVRVQTALLPAHRTRNADFRMEAYSQARFLAITGLDAAGSLEHDFTAVAQRWLAQYFPPTEAPAAGEWHEGPVIPWEHPLTDAELIERACRSSSPRAIWGGRAAFTDLWTGNVEILHRVFPSQTGQAYDGSAADQALANHLAFWTRNDCPRMESLIKQSGLARDKHHRPDYMRRTILAACASQTEWYTGGAVSNPLTLGTGTDDIGVATPNPALTIQLVGAPPQTIDTAPVGASLVGPPAGALQPGELPEPGSYMAISRCRDHFAGYKYVKSIERIQLPDGTTQNKSQFDAMRGSCKWAMEPDGSKPSSSAWDCYLFNQIYAFDRVDGQYFSPRDPTGCVRKKDGQTEVNCYAPLEIRRAEGDPTPFIQHVQRLLPHDWQLMIYTLAARVKFQGVKFMWAPFLQGTKGNGKTLLAKILEYSIGKRYVHWPKSDQLDEKFNAVLTDKIIIIVDEMPRNALDIEPVLNSLVTATSLEVRPMYAEKIMRDVCFNMMFISNHRTSLQCDPDQRRYAPFFCAQQHKADLARDGLTVEYFQWFRDWLENRDGFAICAHYLSTLHIPREYHPDVSIRAPETSSTYAAYRASYTPAEQEILAAVEEARPGFRNGWLSSHAADMVWAQAGRARHLPLNTRRQIIEGLGYVPHPSLPDGLATQTLPDGTRPRLYLREDHPWNTTMVTAAQVVTGYLESQK